MWLSVAQAGVLERLISKGNTHSIHTTKQQFTLTGNIFVFQYLYLVWIFHLCIHWLSGFFFFKVQSPAVSQALTGCFWSCSFHWIGLLQFFSKLSKWHNGSLIWDSYRMGGIYWRYRVKIFFWYRVESSLKWFKVWLVVIQTECRLISYITFCGNSAKIMIQSSICIFKLWTGLTGTYTLLFEGRIFIPLLHWWAAWGRDGEAKLFHLWSSLNNRYCSRMGREGGVCSVRANKV